MSLYTIIIPCHNDCEKAEKLINNLNNVIIGHNGCKTRESFFWSNKAKTINYLAKNINTEYIIVMDADIDFSDFSFLAFEREMKNGVKFGTAVQVYRDIKGKIWEMSFRTAYQGAFWFIKTELLKKYPIPENIVVEDTAYHDFLKKKDIKCKLIIDAIGFTEPFKEGLKASMKQAVRYNLGALQLMKSGSYKYASVVLFNLLVDFFLLYILFSSATKIFNTNYVSTDSNFGFFISLFLLGFLPVLGLIYSISKNNKIKYMFISFFHLLIAPSVAIYLFLRKRSIW